MIRQTFPFVNLRAFFRTCWSRVFLIVLSLFVVTPIVQAVDIVISDDQTTTQELNEEDTFTLNGTGSINVADGGGILGSSGEGLNTITLKVGSSITSSAKGIFVYGQHINGSVIGVDSDFGGGLAGGASNIVNQEAGSTITTTGSNAMGIRGHFNNLIIQNGTLSTTGDFASGISGEINNTITQSGSLETSGNYAHGMVFDQNNLVTQSGTLDTIGKQSYGIYSWGSHNSVIQSGTLTTAGSYAYGVRLTEESILTQSGSIRTNDAHAHGVYLFSTGNVLHVSGSIETNAADACSILSGSSGYVPSVQNSVHILKDASLIGDVRNSTSNGTSVLTFGYTKDGFNQADLTSVDSTFAFTFQDDILSDSDGRWDGFFAGGNTTLGGMENSFRNVYVGGASFDTISIPNGHDGSGNAAEATINPIIGATATLNITKALDTNGTFTVGTGSIYNLSGTHTHTGGNTSIFGTFDMADGGSFLNNASSGTQSIAKLVVSSGSGTLGGTAVSSVTTADIDGILNYTSTADTTFGTTNLAGVLNQNSASDLTLTNLTIDGDAALSRAGAGALNFVNTINLEEGGSLVVNDGVEVTRRIHGDDSREGLNTITLKTGSNLTTSEFGIHVYGSHTNSSIIGYDTGFVDGLSGGASNIIVQELGSTITGSSYNGIQASSNNSITQSGDISTTGSFAVGIQASSNNSITQSGDISTTGNFAVGVDGSSNNSITQSGDILTAGTYATGISVFSNNNITQSGNISTTGSLSSGISGYHNNSITQSGHISTTRSESDGIWMIGSNNVLNASGTIEAIDSSSYSIRSGNDGFSGETNTVNILRGASLSGDIHNDDSNYDDTSYLTFGYLKDVNNEADHSQVDSAFDFTFSDDITSDSYGRWDGYFAGGTTTLLGSSNVFRDMSIGGDSFVGEVVPDGYGYAGGTGIVQLNEVDGATAILNVGGGINTSGSFTIGEGSTYNLTGSHADTGADFTIDGTFNYAASADTTFPAIDLHGTLNQNSLNALSLTVLNVANDEIGSLGGSNRTSVTIADIDGTLNYSGTANSTFTTTNLGGSLNLNSSGDLMIGTLSIDGDAVIGGSGIGDLTISGSTHFLKGSTLMVDYALTLPDELVGSDLGEGLNVITLMEGAILNHGVVVYGSHRNTSLVGIDPLSGTGLAGGASNIVTQKSFSSIASNQDLSGIFGFNNNRLVQEAHSDLNTNKNYGFGISALDNNYITQSGTLNTLGTGTYGIYVDNRNIIEQEGFLTTLGSSAFGIYAKNLNTIIQSGDLETDGENASGIVVSANNNLVQTGSVKVYGLHSYGVHLSDAGNVLHLSGNIHALDDAPYSIRSESNSGTTEDNTIHILSGTTIVGDIYNAMSSSVPVLTFGYEKDANNQANLSSVDNDFRWSFNDNIVSDSTGRWDAYLAGGTLTLSGSENDFRNVFVGASTFDGATVADGHDSAAQAATANLLAIDGATATLNVTESISTNGSFSVGEGSIYNLSGSHAHTGLAMEIDGTLNYTANADGILSAITLGGTLNQNSGYRLLTLTTLNVVDGDTATVGGTGSTVVATTNLDGTLNQNGERDLALTTLNVADGETATLGGTGSFSVSNADIDGTLNYFTSGDSIFTNTSLSGTLNHNADSSLTLVNLNVDGDSWTIGGAGSGSLIVNNAAGIDFGKTLNVQRDVTFTGGIDSSDGILNLNGANLVNNAVSVVGSLIVDDGNTGTVSGNGSIDASVASIFGTFNYAGGAGSEFTTTNLGGILNQNSSFDLHIGSLVVGGNATLGGDGSGMINVSGSTTLSGGSTLDVDHSVLFSGQIVGSDISEGQNVIILGSDANILSSDDYKSAVVLYGTHTNTGLVGIDSASGSSLSGGASNIFTQENGSEIVTSGYESFGISLDYNNSLVQSGSIVTTGSYTQGIRALSNNEIFQGTTGKIFTSGVNYAYGVSLLSNNVLTQSGEITTTGDYSDGVYGGSLNVITQSGTITTSGKSAEAMSLASHNTITQSGRIETAGYSAQGIVSQNSNTISQIGTIVTEGDYADGINGLDSNNITQSGTITTSGKSAEGIYVRYYNTIAQSGTIETSGYSAQGIQAEQINTILQTGRIVTRGEYGDGILATHANTITQSGDIVTSGENAEGLQLGWYNSVLVDGSIQTSGLESEGISVTGENEIIYTGRIETTGENAEGIYLYQNGNVLHASGSIVASGLNSFSIVSGRDRSTDSDPIYVNKSTIHLLDGVSLSGGIHNGDSDGNGTSVLTFGYDKSLGNKANITAIDDSFDFTFSDSITSASMGAWDGYVAGGLTTLSGGENQFRNVFVGASSFDGAEVSDGHDGAYGGATVTLDAIDDATSTLNVTSSVSTNGTISVGNGSTYHLTGTHTHTGGDVGVEGTLDLSDGGHFVNNATSGNQTVSNLTIHSGEGTLGGHSSTSIALATVDGALNFEGTTEGTEITELNLDGILNQNATVGLSITTLNVLDGETGSLDGTGSFSVVNADLDGTLNYLASGDSVFANTSLSGTLNHNADSSLILVNLNVDGDAWTIGGTGTGSLVVNNAAGIDFGKTLNVQRDVTFTGGVDSSGGILNLNGADFVNNAASVVGSLVVSSGNTGTLSGVGSLEASTVDIDGTFNYEGVAESEFATTDLSGVLNNNSSEDLMLTSLNVANLETGTLGGSGDFVVTTANVYGTLNYEVTADSTVEITNISGTLNHNSVNDLTLDTLNIEGEDAIFGGNGTGSLVVSNEIVIESDDKLTLNRNVNFQGGIAGSSGILSLGNTIVSTSGTSNLGELQVQSGVTATIAGDGSWSIDTARLNGSLNNDSTNTVSFSQLSIGSGESATLGGTGEFAATNVTLDGTLIQNSGSGMTLTSLTVESGEIGTLAGSGAMTATNVLIDGTFDFEGGAGSLFGNTTLNGSLNNNSVNELLLDVLIIDSDVFGNLGGTSVVSVTTADINGTLNFTGTEGSSFTSVDLSGTLNNNSTADLAVTTLSVGSNSTGVLEGNSGFSIQTASVSGVLEYEASSDSDIATAVLNGSLYLNSEGSLTLGSVAVDTDSALIAGDGNGELIINDSLSMGSGDILNLERNVMFAGGVSGSSGSLVLGNVTLSNAGSSSVGTIEIGSEIEATLSGSGSWTVSTANIDGTLSYNTSADSVFSTLNLAGTIEHTGDGTLSIDTLTTSSSYTGNLSGSGVFDLTEATIDGILNFNSSALGSIGTANLNGTLNQIGMGELNITDLAIASDASIAGSGSGQLSVSSLQIDTGSLTLVRDMTVGRISGGSGNLLLGDVTLTNNGSANIATLVIPEGYKSIVTGSGRFQSNNMQILGSGDFDGSVNVSNLTYVSGELGVLSGSHFVTQDLLVDNGGFVDVDGTLDVEGTSVIHGTVDAISNNTFNTQDLFVGENGVLHIVGTARVYDTVVVDGNVNLEESGVFETNMIVLNEGADAIIEGALSFEAIEVAEGANLELAELDVESNNFANIKGDLTVHGETNIDQQMTIGSETNFHTDSLTISASNSVFGIEGEVVVDEETVVNGHLFIDDGELSTDSLKMEKDSDLRLNGDLFVENAINASGEFRVFEDKAVHAKSLVMEAASKLFIAGEAILEENGDFAGTTEIYSTGKVQLRNLNLLSDSSLTVWGTITATESAEIDGFLAIAEEAHLITPSTTLRGEGLIEGTLCSDLLVDGGTLVLRRGIVEGHFENNGMLHINGSAFVDGDYTTRSGSTQYFSITENGESDTLRVSGRVELNGGKVVSNLPRALYASGHSLALIEADGGATGAIDEFVHDYAGEVLELSIQADDSGVNLVVDRKSYADFVTGAGKVRTALALDDIVPLAMGQDDNMEALLLSLDYDLTSEGIGAVVGSLSADLYEAFPVVSESNVLGFDSILKNRSDAMLNSPYNRYRLPFWTQITNGKNEREASEDSVGYETSDFGVSFGVERQFKSRINAGASFHYNQSDVSFTQGSYHGEQQSMIGALYGSTKRGQAYVDTAFAYGMHNNTANRGIITLEKEMEASANFSGQSMYFRVGTGYDFEFGKWSVGPLAQFSYMNMEQDDFVEQDADYLAVTMKSVSLSPMYSSLGVYARADYEIRGMVIQPHFRFRYQMNHAADYDSVEFFEGYDDALIERKLKLDESIMDLEAGLRLRLSDRFWAHAMLNFLNSENHSSFKQSVGVEFRF